MVTKTILRMSKILVMAMLLFFLLLRLRGDRLVFHPVAFPYPDGNWEMADQVKGAHKDTFTTPDGVTLHGCFFSIPGADYVMLWCPGSMGNSTFDLDRVKLFQRVGFAVFTFDYRGYGKSDGVPSEEGIYRDTRAAYDFLVNKKSVPPDRIVIFGRSLGGAVAIDLAHRLSRENAVVRAVVVESTWTSSKAMVKEFLGAAPPWQPLPSKFFSLGKVGEIEAPVMVIHGTEDSTVPLSHAQEIFKHIKGERKQNYFIEGGGHNNAYLVAGLQYFREIRKFVDKQ